MNAKQIIPVIAKIAPPVLLGTVIFVALKEFFSAEDTEKKPETAPANAKTENRRKEAETLIFRPIPAEIPAKPVIVTIPAAPKPFIPSLSVASVSKIHMTQSPPLAQIKKKFVTREDIAAIFHRGARGMTRTEAVAALKGLGFRKTAAYDALSEDGRFSDWLDFAPDGIITWTE